MENAINEAMLKLQSEHEEYMSKRESRIREECTANFNKRVVEMTSSFEALRSKCAQMEAEAVKRESRLSEAKDVRNIWILIRSYILYTGVSIYDYSI